MMSNMKNITRKSFSLVILIAMVLMTTMSVGAAPRTTVDIQLIDVSDWHAQLDPLNGIGGAAVLSTYWKADRLAYPNTLTITAGDAFGASPVLSGFFNEEPAVRAMRMMGFNVDTFGNHNFDRGTAHLQSMINLAGAPTSATVLGEPFSYVSSNLQNRDDNLTGVKDYEIFEVGGVKVAVIGVTNPEAPTLVFPGNFGTIVPTDPIPAANKA